MSAFGKADIPSVPAFVRYWTKADTLACPLVTQSRHYTY